MGDSDLGKKVLGWFIVREEDDEPKPPKPATPKTAKKGAAPAAPPPSPAIDPPPRARPAPPPPADDAPASLRLPGGVPEVAAGGKYDAKVFGEVYEAAHITAAERERVEKIKALLQSLPEETSTTVRRQIVEASLKAFNIPIDEIIEAGAQQIQALEAFIQHGERKTQDILASATAQIEKKQKEIEEIRSLMELQVSSQAELVRESNREKLRVQEVLEFFGTEAVERVVRASPKLVEPEETTDRSTPMTAKSPATTKGIGPTRK